MNVDPNQLINGHLDSTLSSDEQLALNHWLKESPRHRERFALAVLLHNRIYVHYQSMKATLDQLDSIRFATVPPRQVSRRWVIVASVVCLLLAVFRMGTIPNPTPTATAIYEFHDLLIQCRKQADRTYRVTFVKDPSRSLERIGDKPLRLPKLAVNLDGPRQEAMLYVRDGRQFVYSWVSAENRESMIGSDGKRSWSINDSDGVKVDGDPLHFTGGLPGGKYLSPILSLFEGQEKLLLADYNLELREPTKATRLFVAVKKPDTIQGPRRIEISFVVGAAHISEMRIWPETPDHRKTDHTLIQLANEDRLAPDWFSPEVHVQRRNPAAASVSGGAD